MNVCTICKTKFSRPDNLIKHTKKYHTDLNDNRLKCSQCETWFTTKTYLNTHLRVLHNATIDIDPQPSTSANVLNRNIVKRKSDIIDSSKSKKIERLIMIKYIVMCVILILEKECTSHISGQISINRLLVFYINQIIFKLLLQHSEIEYNLSK